MSDLIADNAEATAWIDELKAAHSHDSAFGKIVGSVIWSDATGPDGGQLVPVDPVALVADINTNGFSLLKGHDPGFPLGRVLAAEVFTGASGGKFVAAILGFYDGKSLSFRAFGFDALPTVTSPASLPALPDYCWISFGSDPREIDLAWLEDTLSTAPMRVERTERLSHNAADTLS